MCNPLQTQPRTAASMQRLRNETIRLRNGPDRVNEIGAQAPTRPLPTKRMLKAQLGTLNLSLKCFGVPFPSRSGKQSKREIDQSAQFPLLPNKGRDCSSLTAFCLSFSGLHSSTHTEKLKSRLTMYYIRITARVYAKCLKVNRWRRRAAIEGGT